MKLDVIVFDMDGVLFHVHDSYRNAIRQTVQVYLQECLGLQPFDGELVSHEAVTAIKAVSGFNEDWDVTTAILKHFLALLPDGDVLQDTVGRPHGKSATIEAVVEWLRRQGKSVGVTVGSLHERKDLPSYSRALKEAGTGLSAAWSVLGDINDSLLYARGDLTTTNLVKRIFQEIYLGRDLFRQLHGEQALFNQGEGLIHRERLIPDPAVLRRVAGRVQLGIATGRPRGEALFALESAGIRDLFRSVVTYDDVEEAEVKEYETTGERVSLGKPHPYSLVEAVRRVVGSPAPDFVAGPAEAVTETARRPAYIGDNADDVRAANRAKAALPFVSIGCTAVAADHAAMRAEFERAGADAVLDHPDQLVDLLDDRLSGLGLSPSNRVAKEANEHE